jgi:hypothetical protein
MIKSRGNTAVAMTFENGYTISIIYGYGSYSSNKNHEKEIDLSKEYEVTSSTVEIAIWDEDGYWYNFGTDTVNGYVSIDDLAEWIYKTKNFPNLKTENKNE